MITMRVLNFSYEYFIKIKFFVDNNFLKLGAIIVEHFEQYLCVKNKKKNWKFSKLTHE